MKTNMQRRHGDLELDTLERFFRITARHFALADESAVARGLAPFCAGPAAPADRRPAATATTRPVRTGAPRPGAADTPTPSTGRLPMRSPSMAKRTGRSWPRSALALGIGLLALNAPLPRLAHGATPPETPAVAARSAADRPAEATTPAARTTPTAPTARSRQLLDQKHILVAHMVSGSPLARRIEAGDDGAAKGHLTTAREALARAQTALAGDDLALAEQEFDAAIKNLRAARDLAPPPDADLSLAKARFAHLLASVQALRAGYAGLVVGAGSQPGRMGKAVAEAAPGAVAEPTRTASALIDAAHELGRSARYAEASERLQQAQAILLAAYQQNLSDPTVVYPRHFADPEAQFKHELARFNGYHALVPIAIERLRPAEDNRNAIEGRVANAKRLESRAREEAARGDWRAGLASLDRATAVLEQALAIAGVNVPTASPIDEGGQ